VNRIGLFEKMILKIPKFFLNFSLFVGCFNFFQTDSDIMFSIISAIYFTVFFLRIDIEHELKELKKMYYLKNLAHLTGKELSGDICLDKLIEIEKELNKND
jgi:hypothetical protein